MMDRRGLAAAMILLLASSGGAAVMAQSPIPNVNDGNALQRECETALRAADRRERGDGAAGADRDDADRDDADRDGSDVERGYHMGQCLGLVSAVWHTHMLMVDEFDGQVAFCPSDAISAGEMARIVSRYLQVHPAELGNWDTVLIMRAFMDAYPCGRH